MQSIKCQKKVQSTKRNRVFPTPPAKLPFAAPLVRGGKLGFLALLLVGLTSIFSLTATQVIAFVPNRPPVVTGTIEPVTVDVGGDAVTRDVSGNFTDRENEIGNLPLIYSAVSSDNSKATVSMSGAIVSVTPVAAGTATVTVTASDHFDETSSLDFNVKVNGAPAAQGTISPVTLYLGGGTTDVDISGKFSDPNSDSLTYTVVSSDAGVATVSLSGTTVTIAPVAVGTATVTVAASDSRLTGTQTITVRVPNRAPVAVGTIVPVTVHLGSGATDVDVSSKFVDPDGHTLTYAAISSAPSVAIVSVSGGTVKITALIKGTATVTVTARDGNGGTAQRTIAVTVPNRAPVAVGTISAVTLAADGSATDVDVSSKFTDPDNDPLSYTAESSDTTKATVSVSSAIVAITPVAKGTATVTVTARDGSLTATQTISVTVVNQAPVVATTLNAITLNAGTYATVRDLSDAFSDPENATLSYSAESDDTTKVTVNVSSTNLTLTPKAVGSADVTVTASDSLLTATQTFTVTVSANSAPTTVGTISPITMTVGDGGNALNISGKFSDPDGNPLTYTAASSDTGVATASMSGSIVTITAVAAGSATVTVTASDGSGSAAQQTISVTVSNRGPTAVGTISPVIVATNGNAAQVNVFNYFSDPDDNPLSYTAKSSDTTKATVSVLSSTVTITPVAAGSATVTVTASDGSLTATQTIDVTVRQSNRAPTTVGTISPVTVTVGGSAAQVNVSSNFSDPDGDPLSYTAESSDPTKATVSVSSATVTITPKAAGTSTVTVTASDGSLTATQTISVTVNPQPNRKPTKVGSILPITLTAGGSSTNVNVSSKFSDPDNDTLSYTAESSDPTKATVSMSSAVVTITPVAVGGATVTVTASDGDGLTATQTIGVTVSSAPNSAPVAVGTIDPVILTAGGSAANVDVSSKFRDPDNDTLSYSAVSSAASKATVSVSSSVVAITPKAEGTTTVTVTASDPNGLNATQTIGVLVTAAPNRAPTKVGTIPPVTLTAGASATNVGVSTYFSDPDGDTLSYTPISSNTGVATVSVSSSTVTITPVAEGTTTVTVTASDPNGLTATQPIGVLVTAAPNRGPVASGTIPPVTLTTDGSAANVDVSSSFSDPDSDPLTYTAVSSDTTKAMVEVSGNFVVITPVAEGAATVTATAHDPNGLNATQTIAVLVTQGTGTVPGQVPGQGGSGPQSNSAPVAVGTVTPITVPTGDNPQTVNLSTYFSDGGALTYTAVSTDPSKATVSVSGPIATIAPVAEGATTIMVTARNSAGLTTTQTIAVLVTAVPNRAPVAAGAILPVTLTAEDSAQTVNLSTYFSDPDGDTLSYTAISSDPRVATIVMSSSIITITPVAEGTTTVQVTASDGKLNRHPDHCCVSESTPQSCAEGNRKHCPRHVDRRRQPD